MKKKNFLFAVTASAVLLAALPAGKAQEALTLPSPNLVTPADSFNIAVIGTTYSQSEAAYLVTPLTPTFGLTQSFAGSGPTAGETITVSSSESIGATRTTDTITITASTSFDPAGTTFSADGASIGIIFFELGELNAGTNTLDFATPIVSPLYTGSVTYSGTSTLNTSSAATSHALLTNGNMSFADYTSISAGGSDLGAFAVSSSTITISYLNASVVPEPSTWAMRGLGLVGGAVMVRRRRLAA